MFREHHRLVQFIFDFSILICFAFTILFLSKLSAFKYKVLV